MYSSFLLFFSSFLNFLWFHPPFVFLFSPVLARNDFGAFEGDFFLPRVTWVHPSLLLGWSPIFVEMTEMLVFGVVFVVVIDDDDIDESVAVVDVITVALAVFCGQDLEK